MSCHVGPAETAEAAAINQICQPLGDALWSPVQGDLWPLAPECGSASCLTPPTHTAPSLSQDGASLVFKRAQPHFSHKVSLAPGF